MSTEQKINNPFVFIGAYDYDTLSDRIGKYVELGYELIPSSYTVCYCPGFIYTNSDGSTHLKDDTTMGKFRYNVIMKRSYD